MTERIYNFSAGPAVLPVEVLEKAQSEMLSLGGIGMSVMEISHRSKHFEPILDGAIEGIRELLNVSENYKILFLQGGASLQFSMIPLNFLGKDETADYIVTGAWGKKALKEGKRCGNANMIFSTADSGFKSVPAQDEISFSENAKYVHYTSNETIEGVEFKYDLDGKGAPVVCDASSNILSKPIDVEKHALIYAGAQKNIGPSGVTLVIIRDDLIEQVPANQHSILDYRALAENNSMLNTPNTWGIYIINLVCEHIKGHGGLAEMEKKNEAKAKILYDAIDASDGFYRGHAEKSARSLMNVTFRLPSEELEKQFASKATAQDLDGLKGHRSVGGIRASIYNAFPREGVEVLVAFMKDFAQKNG
ncbi:MAG: 3-phosphoserine/phosphohydroxythreonine transaminase [Acidobacteria bacterium]|nr:3-phosphoserine/phosphohydroxythreonine transaminase [Acidobacteriota bacterium]MCA1637487.1 3-phosphoserine/phosphohydroxythreonine transaminase [Acidobacteriota bacterium]